MSIHEAVEALAKRNYESEWGDGWEGVIDQIKRGWLKEAQAQVDVVVPYFTHNDKGRGTA